MFINSYLTEWVGVKRINNIIRVWAISKYKNETEVIESLPTGTETILLVEDSDKVRVFANRILTHLGYHIVQAADATEALEYIRHHEDIDLLFTDIVMPGNTDGIGLAEQACSHLPSLRVLLTTGMYFHADDHRNPVIDYPLLAKPYSAKQLAQSIRNILDTGQITDWVVLPSTANDAVIHQAVNIPYL